YYVSDKGKALNILVVDYIDGKKWRLRREFKWKFRDGRIIIVEPFVFDFNSIPRLFWRVLPPVKYGEAGTVHDWCYRTNGKVSIIDIDGQEKQVEWSRKECDKRY